jgi:uncharacterized protein YjbI with pentapeptide repeats
VNARGAVLRGVSFAGASLMGANLSGCDLRGADLGRALLHGTDLTGTDLSGALVSSTVFAWCPTLAGAKGLDRVIFNGPVALDAATLAACRAALPAVWLEKAKG